MTPAQFAHGIAQGGLFAELWWLIVLCAFLFGPFIAVYCLVRFFRDLRRIAVALERCATVEERFNKELDEIPAEKIDGYRAPILNSMFGR